MSNLERSASAGTRRLAKYYVINVVVELMHDGVLVGTFSTKGGAIGFLSLLFADAEITP